MTTTAPPAAASVSISSRAAPRTGVTLPTGSCQFRLLESGHTCGCQRFRFKRKPEADCGSDDEFDECRCTHDACFHRYDSTLSITTDVAASNAVGLSAVSGTTTERDPSISNTPSTAVARSAVRIEEKSVMMELYKKLTEPKEDVNGQIKNLVEAINTLKNHQVLQQERLEMVEGLPAVLEELHEKLELIDERSDERHYSFETKLENKLDDRLGPIEAFIRTHSEKKRKRKHYRRDSEVFENSSSIRGDRKRRRGNSERESSEVINSQPPPPFGVNGITTTTTTSFTTTTSTSTSFSASSPTIYKSDDFQNLKFQLEQLKNRLTDVESVGPPSAMRPWVVEIVLIPPSPLVQGVWRDADASVTSTQYESGEVGPSAAAIPKSSAPLTGYLPRSFSPNSKIYKRLFTRGFVRHLHITGPTAKEVSIAIEVAFQHIIDWCLSFATSRASSKSQKSQYSSASSQRTTKGRSGNLQTPQWQPLRKVYKQTVLEYLPDSDLATPALWSVDYLKVNCVMKSRSRKVLYIMPSALAPTVTWNDIRFLKPFYDLEEQQPHDEVCWDFDSKLDGKAPDAETSFFDNPYVSFSLDNENGAGTIARTSFKSSAPPQEPTPPATVPGLPLTLHRQPSKLNLQAISDDDVDSTATTEKLKSRSGGSSAAKKSAPPPSPPHSVPAPPVVANRRSRSPTVPDSPVVEDFGLLGAGSWEHEYEEEEVGGWQLHADDDADNDDEVYGAALPDESTQERQKHIQELFEDEDVFGDENALPPAPLQPVSISISGLLNPVEDPESGDGGYHSD